MNNPRVKRRKVYKEIHNRTASINPIYMRELTNNISKLTPKFKVKKLYYRSYIGNVWNERRKKYPLKHNLLIPKIEGIPESINIYGNPLPIPNYVFAISMPPIKRNGPGHSVVAIKYNNFLYVFDPHGRYRKIHTNNMVELLRTKLNIPSNRVRIYNGHPPQRRNTKGKRKGVCVGISRLFMLFMVEILNKIPNNSINQNTFNKLISNHFANLNLNNAKCNILNFFLRKSNATYASPLYSQNN